MHACGLYQSIKIENPQIRAELRQVKVIQISIHFAKFAPIQNGGEKP